jgi:hypothetical protein
MVLRSVTHYATPDNYAFMRIIAPTTMNRVFPEPRRRTVMHVNVKYKYAPKPGMKPNQTAQSGFSVLSKTEGAAIAHLRQMHPQWGEILILKIW